MLRTHPLQNNKSQNTTKDAVCITQYIPSRIRPLAKKRDGDYEALEALYPSQKYRTLASFCALSAVLFVVFNSQSPILKGNLRQIHKNVNMIGSNGLYRGEPYISDRTIQKRIVAETKFARCEYHTVVDAENPSLNSVFNDWLFMEEKDAINVIVADERGKFLIFKQEKYAIPGETLSPVGGFIDDGETPFEAAKREVKEELGMGSRKTKENIHTDEMQKNKEIKSIDEITSTWDAEIGRITDNDPDWVYLGKYRTSANRGGGYLYSYFLKNAVPIAPDGGTPNFIPSGDAEPQVLLHLSEVEIFQALSTSQFKEVKWTTTISLALLHLRENLPGNT